MADLTLSNLRGVFEELADQPRWVCWREVVRDDPDDPAKVPIDPGTGEYASVSDRETWGTLEEALRRNERDGLDGVGIVLGGGLGGNDLDACRNPETGELTPWAERILDRFEGCYAEVSPSGTGVKILALDAPDELPASLIPMETSAIQNGKRPQIEAYVGGRYFTVTGDVLEGWDTLRPAPDAWDAMARELRERGVGASESTDGDQDPGWFEKALEGVPEGQRDVTATKIAGRLARDLTVPEPVAVEFVQWWNRERNPKPLSDSQVAKCVRSIYRKERRERGDEKLDPEVWIASDLVKADIPDPGWAAEGFLPLEDVGVIAALFDTGKTWVQLQSAIDLWQARPLFDRFPVRSPLRSLIIMGEGTPKGTQKRLLTLCRGAGADPTDLDGVHIVHDLRAKLGDANLDEFLREYLQEREIDVLWMDPFSEFLAGSEGDDEDLKAAIRPLRAIRDDLGTTVVLVHHARQPSDQDIGKPAGVLWRGRTNLPDWADIGYTLEGPGRSDIRVEKAKSRNVALEEEEYTLRWVEGETEEGDTLRLVHEAESEIISGGYDLSEAQERAVEEIRRTLVNHGPDSVSFYTGKSSRKGGPRGWSEALEKALEHLEETRDVYVDREYRYDGRQHTVMWWREAMERGYVDLSDLQGDAFDDTATVGGPS